MNSMRPEALLRASSDNAIFIASIIISIIKRAFELYYCVSHRIQYRLELADEVAELVCTAGFADHFIHVALMGNGLVPANNNGAVGEEALLDNRIRIVIPAGILKL